MKENTSFQSIPHRFGWWGTLPNWVKVGIALVATCFAPSVSFASVTLPRFELMQVGTGPVTPAQTAFFDASGSGSTVNVEMRSSGGLEIPFVDSTGATFGAVTLTIPAGTARGFGYLVTQTKPDGTHFLNTLTNGGATLIVNVTSGSVTINTAGTIDSSVGSGGGIATQVVAPNATTPTALSIGTIYFIAPGGNVTVSSGQSTNAAMPINLNPLAVCLFDAGGSGDTLGVEYIDANGIVIPMVDTASVKWSAITVTLGASGTRGLSYLVLHTSPDGTHPIAALPSGAVACRLRVINGSTGVPTVTINTGGTVDGSAGTGTNGYATGYNPTASSPVALFILDIYVVGRVRS